MFGFHEVVESTLLQLLSECETEEEWREFWGRRDQVISEVVDEMANNISSTIMKGASNDLKAMREERRQFERRLADFWRVPMDRLEAFMWVAFEAGMKFNEKHREIAAKSNDHVFEALTRLHAKACQTSFAIFTLLKSGFADDAYARWRSLHEIAVIGNFISENSQELAEKYLLHEVVQQYKIACAQRRVQGRNNEEEISEEDFAKMKSLRDKLVARYGNRFKLDYGWAEGALTSKSPTFHEIEKQVRLDHFRPFYRMASDNVHANSHGIYFRLGLDQNARKVLLAGASTAGLANPGHSTAISLMQITITLLATKPSIDTNITMAILTQLTDEVGEAFLETHKKHEPIVPAKTE